jgi:periplasmic protein CpxP/Spy
MFWFRSAILSSVLIVAYGVTLGAASAQTQLNFGSYTPSPAVKNSPSSNSRNGEQLVKTLNLTPRQVVQLKAIRQKFQGQKQGQKQQLNAAKQELSELVANNAPANKIRDQRERVKTLQQKFSALKFDHMMALKEILTPEQWVKLQKIKQQRAKNMSGNS